MKERRMRVCIINEIANCAYHLASGLASLGNEVEVLLDTSRKKDKRLLFNYGAPPGVEVKWFSPLFRPRALGLAPAVIREVLSYRPDIAHAQYLWSHLFITEVAGKIGKLPTVGTAHGWDTLVVPTGPRSLVQRAFLPAVDMVILTTNYLYRPIDYLPPDKVRCVNRTVDTNIFRERPDDGAELVARYGDFVTFTARLNKIKTPFKVIRAFAQAARLVDVNLLILGDGPERNEMEALARKLGIEERVIFLGTVPNIEIPKYFSASLAEVRGFVCPDLGVAQLEALSCGLPVITHTGGPVKQVPVEELDPITDEIRRITSGFTPRNMEKAGVISASSDEEIANSIVRIVQNRSLRRKLGRLARGYILHNHSVEAGATATMRVYEEILQVRR